jgi:hypothetical protein
LVAVTEEHMEPKWARGRTLNQCRVQGRIIW